VTQVPHLPVQHLPQSFNIIAKKKGLGSEIDDMAKATGSACFGGQIR